MSLPSVFLFYMEKKKISSLYRDETTIFFYMIYMEDFFQDFLRYTNKNQRSIYLR